ncbi:carbohydrate porin [Sphingomonas sp. SRS2]|uniref:carbohydrate porin n=1 Tax=Sphingomonas sp. SRS2 TaxID=133190 RepID=UPI0009FED704|nr:carbohydrate porin [Sphingomonas sp. SRS2]
MLAAALLASTAAVAATGDLPQPTRHAHSYTHAEGEIDEVQGPILLETTYTGEVIGVAAGGVRRGTRYLDNLDIVLEADLVAVAGWRGAMLHVYGLYNNGTSVSDLAGDAQAASNIETGDRALRLYEAWIDQKLGSHASVKVGRYDLNSEFDALETSGLFLGSAHGIGTDISQTGLSGPSIFPKTSLAARLEVRPADGWAVRAAILDGVANRIDFPPSALRKDGALLIGEAELPVLGGRMLIGHWHYTARFDAHDGRRERGNGGVYLRGEAPIASGPAGTLAGFFRLGTANGRLNMFDRFASAGMKLTGWLDGRDEDELGLAVATAFTARDYRLAQGSGKAETAIELTYRAPIAPWLSVQPNVQYVRNPSADPTIADALVLGLRFETSFRLIGSTGETAGQSLL